MNRRVKRWFSEAIKIAALAACFLLLEQQIVTLQSELAVKHAMALDSYRVEFARARDELEGSVRSSQRSIEAMQVDLAESARAIKTQGEGVSQLISNRDDSLRRDIGTRLSDYQGTMQQILEHSQEATQRLRSVEARVATSAPPDAHWLERSILLPIVQLKGDGTVGSGVIVYSRPRVGSESETKGSDGAAHTTFVVTACHVVMEILGRDFPAGAIERVNVLRPDRTMEMDPYTARIEVYDEAKDLALLRLDSPRRFEHVASLAPKSDLDALKLFTRVYAVGCPLGNQPLPTSGEISSKSKLVGQQLFWMMNAPTFFGNSGGGIFLGETGELIGISSMIYTYGKARPVVVPHMGLFVPIDAVSDWLDARGYGFVGRGEPESAASPEGRGGAEGAAPQSAEAASPDASTAPTATGAPASAAG